MVVVAEVGSAVDPEEEEEGEGSRLEVAVRPEAGVDSEDPPEAGSAVVVAAVDVVPLAAVAEAATKFAREACGTGTPDHLPPSRAPFRLAATSAFRVVASARPSFTDRRAREWPDGRASVVFSGLRRPLVLLFLSLSGIRRSRFLVIFIRTFSLPIVHPG